VRELESLRELALGLKERGYTLNVLKGGRPILKMGKDARPGLLSFIGPIEVKDLKGILEFLKD